MPVTPQQVKDESFTGEFNAMSDAVIQHAIDEAALHYTWLPQRKARAEVVAHLIALHAAHMLHQGKKYEGGEDNGGGGGQAGPVKSASLDRVGSWSFGAGSDLGDSPQGNLPLEDWADSPYGRRWRSLWSGVPPATATTRRPFV